MLTEKLLAATRIACLCWLSGVACAAEPNPAAPSGNAPLHSTVLRIHGKVEATSPNGKPRTLVEGSQIVVGETVRASADGEAVLKTLDAGMIAVRPGAEFVVEQYAATGQSTDRQTVRLVKGALRTITGWIGHIDKSRDKLVTPGATIGIRGTDHEPYVLLEERAGSTLYKPGTYDKVNRGATTLNALDADGNDLDIAAGQVGFAQSLPAKRHRALMTLLLPTLLDKIPDFYVPGRFERDVDAYSAQADRESLLLLEQARQKSEVSATSPCPAQQIASEWVAQFDAALERRDAKAILGFFAPEITARATVRTNTGKAKTVEFDRGELVDSTLRSVSSLEKYQHRRISIDAASLDAGSAATCSRLLVTSVVIEEGLLSGKAFRFESREVFTLELRGKEWMAVDMETTQL